MVQKDIKKYIYLFLGFLYFGTLQASERLGANEHESFFLSKFSGAEWDIRITPSSIIGSGTNRCYYLELQSAVAYSWALGDQNYRLFFDGDLMTVTSVTSHLPSGIYADAQINQNVKITGRGQEAFSPLDDIDDNLGFLDFSIFQSDKSNPSNAAQISPLGFMRIAEICVDVDIPAVQSGAENNWVFLTEVRGITFNS